MLQEHGGSWPETFMGWMQRRVGENEAGIGNTFPFSCITKRVDVSMGCQDCESHKSVMAAVAACSGAQGERRTTGLGRVACQ